MKRYNNNNNKIVRDWIIDNALFLELGRTTPNETCPFCKGGIHHDKSFSCTRTDTGYLYNCYRASCSHNGYIPTVAASVGKEKLPAHFRAQTYTWACVPLSEAQRSYFTHTYGLTIQELQSSGILYNTDRDSFAWPIRDARGFTVGILDRVYEGLTARGPRRPKAITYWFNDVPKIYFPSGIELFKGRVVIVEDVISAIKGNRYVPTVAVLNAHISSPVAVALSLLYASCTIALDADATGNAVKLAKELGLVFKDGAKVLQLHKDIKDLDNEEVGELLLGTRSVEPAVQQQRGVGIS